jgi:hypothetical protein
MDAIVDSRSDYLFIKTFPSTYWVMPEYEDDKAGADRCLQLARAAGLGEDRLRWLKQAEFWLKLSARGTEPAKPMEVCEIVDCDSRRAEMGGGVTA